MAYDKLAYVEVIRGLVFFYFFFNLKWFKFGFSKRVGPLKQLGGLKDSRPLKRSMPLKRPRRISGPWVGLSGHAISTKIFTQFQLRNLPKLRLFILLPINTSLRVKRLEKLCRDHIEIVFRDLLFLRKDLLEKKLKVLHHSWSLIQGLFFES